MKSGEDQDDAIIREGGGARRVALLDAIGMVDGINKDMQEYQSLQKDLVQDSKQQKVIAKLYQHAIDARKLAVQDIFAAVADLANAMYEQMHPNEGIAKSVLSVREATRASVILLTDFFGELENPILHHSESHLDTLGLCYFLALRKRAAEQYPDFKLLVLDDVVYSVDAAHRSRLPSLLNKYFSDHQIVITTHDPVFFQRLKETLGGNGTKYIRLTGWDLERGPLCGDSLVDIDRVCCKPVREVKSPEELSGACGRFFEMFLKRIAERLQVSVIAKFDGRYEINDLWPPVQAKLSKRKSFVSIHAAALRDGQDLSDNLRGFLSGFAAHVSCRIPHLGQGTPVNLIRGPVVKTLMGPPCIVAIKELRKLFFRMTD